MMTLRKQNSTKYRGFTLIELVVVIALIFAITSISLPRLIDHYDNAKIASITANLEITRTAIAFFFANQLNQTGAGRYPTYAEFNASTPNTVYDQPLLENPYETNSSNTVRQWLPDDGSGSPMILVEPTSGHGWNYYPDGNVFDGRKFWANTNVNGEDAL